MRKVRFSNQMQNFHKTRGVDLVELLGVFPGDIFKNIGLVRKKNGKVCIRFLTNMVSQSLVVTQIWILRRKFPRMIFVYQLNWWHNE